ncbi:MAG: bifunctional nuclease family protein [Actinomycetota bacterium]
MSLEQNGQNQTPPQKVGKTNRQKPIIIAAGIFIFILIAATALIFLIYPYLDRDREEISLLVGPDQNLVKVTLEGIRMDTQANQPVILLKEEGGNTYLPIWIGAAEAIAISLELSGTETPRPMTHDLMVDVLEALGTAADSVIITKVEENTFYAALRLRDREGNLVEVDSRPSDGIAIAVRTSCQILVTEDLLKSHGVEVEADDQQFERLRI